MTYALQWAAPVLHTVPGERCHYQRLVTQLYTSVGPSYLYLQCCTVLRGIHTMHVRYVQYAQVWEVPQAWVQHDDGGGGEYVSKSFELTPHVGDARFLPRTSPGCLCERCCTAYPLQGFGRGRKGDQHTETENKVPDESISGLRRPSSGRGYLEPKRVGFRVPTG